MIPRRIGRAKRLCTTALTVLMLSLVSLPTLAAPALPLVPGFSGKEQAQVQTFATPNLNLQSVSFEGVTVYGDDVSAVTLENNIITLSSTGQYLVYPNGQANVKAQFNILADDVHLSMAAMELSLPNGNSGAVIDFKGSNGILSLTDEGGVLDVLGSNAPALKVEDGKSLTLMQSDLYDGKSFRFGSSGVASGIEGIITAQNAVVVIGGSSAPAITGYLTAFGSYISLSSTKGGFAVDFNHVGISSADSIITIAADTAGMAVGGSVPSGIDMILAELSTPATAGILEKDGITSIAGIFQTYEGTAFTSIASIWDTGVFRIGVNLDPSVIWQQYESGDGSFKTNIPLNSGDGLVRKNLSPTPIVNATVSTINSENGTTSGVKIILSQAVPEFSADNIILFDSEGTGATKGKLTQVDWDTITYELALDNITSVGNIGLAFAYYDYSFAPSSLNLQVLPALPLSGIRLSNTEAQLNIGDTLSLAVIAEPEGVDAPDLLWSSSNPDVAAVVNGEVTALAPGTAEITVTDITESFSDMCSLSVFSSEPPSTENPIPTPEQEPTNFPENEPTPTEFPFEEAEPSSKPILTANSENSTPLPPPNTPFTGDFENIATLLSLVLLSFSALLFLKKHI